MKLRLVNKTCANEMLTPSMNQACVIELMMGLSLPKQYKNIFRLFGREKFPVSK